ncbi:MAG: hypothetical protein GC206_08160 [Alphaproteobacteria bacterium]|nr:hypothetical protein [Alphaproteobacteria bacterium]
MARVSTLRVFIVAAATLAASAGAALAQSVSDLSGEWRGSYFSAAAEQTPFEATIDHSGAAISGTIVEPNGFGDPGVRYLLAELQGRVRGDVVEFTKTYVDEDGGVTHSVLYRGTLSNQGRRIRGSWTLEGGQGNFEMVR